jgi:hypothetical protein
MKPLSFKRRRFSADVILHAVWLYFRIRLSFQDVEALLAERGIDVSYESIRCWTIKFGPQIASRLKRRRPPPSPRWHLTDGWRPTVRRCANWVSSIFNIPADCGRIIGLRTATCRSENGSGNCRGFKSIGSDVVRELEDAQILQDADRAMLMTSSASRPPRFKPLSNWHQADRRRPTA